MGILEKKQPSFGFVSTRFAGLDGVSLEAKKWVQLMTEKGCDAYYMAGELDTDPDISHLSPKSNFKHPEIEEIQQSLFVEKKRTPALSERIQHIKEEIKADLFTFQTRFDFDILVIQNALAIPVNIPLGLAITEFIIETGMPTIAHHHDFFWERERFNSAAAGDYLRAAFPPVHPNIQHVVLNSLAGHQFGKFLGASWTLIPNVLDFKKLPPGPDAYNRTLKTDIGLDADTLMVVQPTRVISRKGIETSAELVKRLGYEKAALVITHKSGDEGHDYRQRIEEFARFIGVDLRIISDHIGMERGRNQSGRKIYTLWDVYQHADLVTYPSVYEGYGNAFVEAIYFRKPIVINRYPIFVADIEPKGFDVVAISSFLTEEAVDSVRRLLVDPARVARMAEHNYMLGWRYLSFELLEEKLDQLLVNYYGS